MQNGYLSCSACSSSYVRSALSLLIMQERCESEDDHLSTFLYVLAAMPSTNGLEPGMFVRMLVQRGEDKEVRKQALDLLNKFPVDALSPYLGTLMRYWKTTEWREEGQENDADD